MKKMVKKYPKMVVGELYLLSADDEVNSNFKKSDIFQFYEKEKEHHYFKKILKDGEPEEYCKYGFEEKELHRLGRLNQEWNSE